MEVGIVVLCLINVFICLFIILIFKDNGVILSNIIFLILFVIILVWIVVFIVIILFGLIFLCGFFLIFFLIVFWMVGICVELLIKIILFIFEVDKLVFFNVWWVGFIVFLINELVNFLNLEWVKLIFKCNGLFFLVEMNGNEIWVWEIFDKFFLVFLVVFFNFCNVILFCDKFILFFFLNFEIR